jgi:rhamnosyltransferase
VVDSSSTDGSYEGWSEQTLRWQIPKHAFNHGGTRNFAARQVQADVLVFITQDALPADDAFLENLVRPIAEGRADAAYARQLPRDDAPPTERFARLANYPPVSTLRCPDDDATGVRRHFFSNVASAVASDVFWSLGGFPDDVILNEDMVLASRLLAHGRCIAYAADARVHHSHAYSMSQQFRRYFDIGVALRRGGASLATSGTQREGVRFVRRQLRFLIGEGAYAAVPVALAEAGVKFVGYRLGTLERRLPNRLKRRFSMHSAFWD